MKETIGTQVTLTLKIKLEKSIVSKKYNHCFQALLWVFFNPLLGWECAYVCHKLKRKVFRVKSRNIKEVIGVKVTFISENKHQKEHFLSK